MIRRFFLKRMCLFTLVMLIPLLMVLTISGVLYVSREQQSRTEKLNLTLTRVESMLENRVGAVVRKNDTMLSNARLALAFKKVMKYDEIALKDALVLHAVKAMMVESADACVESIYLYLTDAPRILASDSEEMMYDVDRFSDQRALQALRSMERGQQWLLFRRSLSRHSFVAAQPVLSICKRMNNVDGAIMLNVRQSTLQDEIDSLVASPEYDILLLTEQGDVLYAENEAAYAFAETLPALLMQEDCGGLEHGGYVMRWKKSPYMPLYQVVMLSKASIMKQMWQTLFPVLLLILLIVALTALLAWISTKHSFRYIEQCVGIFMMADRGDVMDIPKPDVKDEYGMILSNIINMYLCNTQMRFEIKEKQTEKEMAERFALQLQINPHFISNTLQTIDMVVQREVGSQSVSRNLLRELNSMIRYIFRTPMEPVPLREELAHLKDYCEIQYVRFPEQCIVYFDVDDEAMELKIFRLMLQPLLENCFVHARYGAGRMMYAEVNVHIQQRHVCFSVRDNGKGMSPERLAEVNAKLEQQDGANIGIMNLNRRLTLSYGMDSRLRIESEPGKGTTVSFAIPLEALSGAESKKS